MIEDVILASLKRACEKAGGQLKLARQCGLSQGQLSDYICGRRQIKNMTVGTLEKIFPGMEIKLCGGCGAADPVEQQIQEIVAKLSAREKARCLKILAANFPEQILKEINHEEEK